METKITELIQELFDQSYKEQVQRTGLSIGTLATYKRKWNEGKLSDDSLRNCLNALGYEVKLTIKTKSNE